MNQNKSTSTTRPPKLMSSSIIKLEDPLCSANTATNDPAGSSQQPPPSTTNQLQSAATSTTSSATASASSSTAAYVKRKVWTNEEIEMIINLVHLRPFLYDKRHEDYKQTQKKVTAWIEISAILNTTGMCGLCIFHSIYIFIY